MLKIKYIVTVPKTDDLTETNLTSDTLKSIVGIVGTTRDAVATVRFDEGKEEVEINAEVAATDDSFTHVVVINAGSSLKDHFRSTADEYVTDSEKVYLPLVELYTEEETTGLDFRAFLNSSVWKPYFTDELGILDAKLAKRGVDLILYGAIIPLSVIKAQPLREDIKYYSYFEFFNRILHNKIEIIGLPKTMAKCIKDYELKSIPKDVKIEEFKKAQIEYAAV